MKTIRVVIDLRVEDDVHKNDIVTTEDEIVDGFTLTRLSLNENDHLDKCFKITSAEIIKTEEV